MNDVSRPAGWGALLACFFLSGFAALLYQTAWTREFGAVFGTSELAVATVLAAYMGGLAAGAALAGRFAMRVARPVLVYGLLELGIALAALAVPLAIRAATALQIALLGGRELPADSGGLASALFYLACAFAILLVPTTFMGATLPLLARHAVRSDREVGPRIGTLYAVNTAGAIGGTLVCGFVLLPALGLRGTVWVGVALNALVFALAVLVSRAQPRAVAMERGDANAAAAAVRLPRAFWILPLALLSGGVSFAYEVLWTRLLGHVLGGSIYAFATMLASVLVGIAVGGAIGARLATNPRAGARGFAMAQVATAILATLAFFAIDQVPAFAQRIGAGSSGGLLTNAALAMAILVPPALAIGTTFPFAVRVLARGPADASPASARVYAWNTAGAISGSIAAGFFVLPALGYAGTLVVAVATNLALAAIASLLAPGARIFAGIAAGAALLAIARPSEPWRLLRTSPLSGQSATGDVTYFGVGRAATVLVLRREGRQDLRTNGLPESTLQPRGSRPGTELVAAWLSVLPAAARPELSRMLIVGLGGGLAVESVPANVGAVDVVELEPEVVHANRLFSAWRRADPFADPRVAVRTNDARSALLLSDMRYDAIVSQPSHPWGAGASHLYTREFFSLAASRLTDTGVFVQWIGLSFVDEDLMRSLLATLQDVFPHVRVYRPNPMGVLFLSSAAPLDVESAVLRALGKASGDFGRAGIAVPEDLAASLALDEAGSRALAQGARISTDDRNRLATHSPRVLASPLGVAGANALFASQEPLAPVPAGLDATYLVRRMAAAGLGERAQRIADAQRSPVARAEARAALALQHGRTEIARRLAAEALALDPDSVRALEIALAAAAPDTERASRAGAHGETARALAQARLAAAERRWDALGALDAALAAIDVRSPLALEATRLRARWRLESGAADRAREGMELLDAQNTRFTDRGELRMRAQLAANAGEIPGALATWTEIASGGTPAEREVAVSNAFGMARSAPASALDPAEREAWLKDLAVLDRAIPRRGGPVRTER
ncbi:MAG: fused MFS/spermidine synthase [Myxococcota bacterium]|jgi:spermidine synthase|nr:fused MFS/spermidine synthase [Myxococcota bacterium]